MTTTFHVHCGTKRLAVAAENFQDASWVCLIDHDIRPPMHITNQTTGKALDVIGFCPKCNTDVWLDDDWVVMKRTGRFGHRDCYNPGGFAHYEMFKNDGTVDVPF